MIVRCLACGKVMTADAKHPGYQICECENQTMVDWCDEYLYRLGGVDLSKIEVDGKNALKTPKSTPKKEDNPKKKQLKKEEELSWWRLNLEMHNKHMDEAINYLKHSKDLIEAIVQDNERLSNATTPLKQRDWREFLPGETHPKLKKFWSKTWHIVLSFMLGVAITTVVHVTLSNQRVRTTAEAVCTVFGRDEQECKDGIDDVLDMADNVTQNNTNVKGE